MPLPSQSGRPVSRHSHMFRRGRKRRGPLALLFILLLVVGAVGIWTFNGPRNGEASDDTQVANADGQNQATPEFRDLPVSSSLGGSGATHRPMQHASAGSERPTNPSREIRTHGSDGSMTTTPMTATTETPRTSVEPDATDPAHLTEPPMTSRTDRSGTTNPRTESAGPALRRSTTANEPPPPGHGRAMERVRLGMDHLAANRPIDARRTLSDALMSGGLDRATAGEVRQTLTELNQRLVFSPEVVSGDRFSFAYTIRPGDSLSRIASQQGLAVDWRLIQRINRIPRPEQIRAGQTIKLLTGPFHAVVNKTDFRLDLYLGEGSDRVFVRSYRVGLGEFNSTPEGLFRVRPNSKLINPEWTNPRTGERFLPDDPKNPIGERWIGLQGVSESVKNLGGYGIHGTIEPDSIGRQASMGCVRMLAGDVEVVYEMLAEEISTVEIVPR